MIVALRLGKYGAWYGVIFVVIGISGPRIRNKKLSTCLLNKHHKFVFSKSHFYWMSTLFCSDMSLSRARQMVSGSSDDEELLYIYYLLVLFYNRTYLFITSIYSLITSSYLLITSIYLFAISMYCK